MNYLICTSP